MLASRSSARRSRRFRMEQEVAQRRRLRSFYVNNVACACTWPIAEDRRQQSPARSTILTNEPSPHAEAMAGSVLGRWPPAALDVSARLPSTRPRAPCRPFVEAWQDGQAFRQRTASGRVSRGIRAPREARELKEFEPACEAAAGQAPPTSCRRPARATHDLGDVLVPHACRAEASRSERRGTAVRSRTHVQFPAVLPRRRLAIGDGSRHHDGSPRVPKAPSRRRPCSTCTPCAHAIKAREFRKPGCPRRIGLS